MKNRKFLLVIGALLLLSGCVDSGYQESIRVFLSGTPIVFLIALGLQYLLFRLWKLIYPELTFSWLPNIVFGIALLVIRVILASRIFDNNLHSWFSINDEEFYDIVFIRFLPSFLTILFIVTRVWLFFGSIEGIYLGNNRSHVLIYAFHIACVCWRGRRIFIY